METDKRLIFNRIKLAMGFNKDAELANFLGVTPQTLSNHAKRNSVDWDVLLSKCELINLNWLLYGEGEMLKNSINHSILGNNNVQNNVKTGNNSSADARQYYSDSPDVLRAMVDGLEARIKEKDAQIKEKDAQINKLLGILDK